MRNATNMNYRMRYVNSRPYYARKLANYSLDGRPQLIIAGPFGL